MDLHTSVSSDSLCGCVWDGGREGGREGEREGGREGEGREKGGREKEGREGGREGEGREGGRKEGWCVSMCIQQYNNVLDHTLELNRIVQKG